MYKQATKLALRYPTNKGMLTLEQLWDLNLLDLSKSIVALKKVLKKDDDDELSFLENTKKVDVENQLRFDIMKDVYISKEKDKKDELKSLEDKKHNERIYELIRNQREKQLEQLTVDELEKLLIK